MIVWLIESPHKGLGALSSELIGDFAIRCFASCERFSQLVGRQDLYKAGIAIVIAASDFSQSEVQNITQINDGDGAFNVPILIVTSEVDEVITRNNNLYLVPEGRVYDLGQVILNLERSHASTGNTPSSSQVTYELGDYMIDWQNSTICSIHDPEDLVSLTAKELRLLGLFAENTDVYHSREEIIQRVWASAAISKRTVDSHVSRLRKRLEPLGFDIVSHYGLGYRVVIG